MLSVPASYAFHRRWAYYRSLPITIKVLGVVLVAAPAFAIQAERRGVEFDKAQWYVVDLSALSAGLELSLCASVVLLTRLFNRTGAGKEELDRAKSEFVSRWGEMSVTQRVGDWASRHRYQLFFGAGREVWQRRGYYCGAIKHSPSRKRCGRLVLVHSARTLTCSIIIQIVQARVYAQGITLASLLGGVSLLHMQSRNRVKEDTADHSWARLVSIFL